MRLNYPRGHRFFLNQTLEVTGDTSDWGHYFAAGTVVTVTGFYVHTERMEPGQPQTGGYVVRDTNGEVWNVAEADLSDALGAPSEDEIAEAIASIRNTSSIPNKEKE